MLNEQTWDYIVIGSGFGGSVSAMRLAEKGYSVLVIEKGKRFSASDFPRSNWNIRKFLWLPSLRLFGFQRIDMFKEVGILSGVGVGGGSLVYANTHMFPPDAFFKNKAWAHFRDWKKTLSPFYKKAKFMLGSAPYEKEHYEDKVLHEIAKDMGKESSYMPVNSVGIYQGDTENYVDPYFNGIGPLRKGCIECAGCMVGCRHDAKNTLDKNYLYFAEKFGSHVLAETEVRRIEYENGLYQVTTRSSTAFIKTRKTTYQSRGLVVAAGVLGTLRLLFRQKVNNGTLSRISDKLGHNLRTNSESLCGVTNAKQKLNHGIAISRVFNPDENTHIELCKYPNKSGFMKTLMTLATGDGSGPMRTLKLLANLLTSPLKLARFIFKQDFANNSLYLLVMQTLDNAMIMRWKKGIFSRLKIDNSGQNRVPAYIGIGQEVMHRYAEKTGGIAINATAEVVMNMSSTAHILGGCPMGRDAAEGVVDDKFAVHGYENFYILDGSIIPCNLGVNPSFTITALTEYAMSKIPRKKGSGQKTLDELLKRSASKKKKTRK